MEGITTVLLPNEEPSSDSTEQATIALILPR